MSPAEKLSFQQGFSCYKPRAVGYKKTVSLTKAHVLFGH